MTSRLSTDQLTQLTPLLGSVARLVASGSSLNESELYILLVGVDMESEPAAMDELKRWGRLLTTIRQQPAEENRRATVEALVTRGLPEATAILAVATVAESALGSTAQQDFRSPRRLIANVERLDFSNLGPGSSAVGEFEIRGGPGQIVLESDQIAVHPIEFGYAPTRIRVEVKSSIGSVLWTTLKLVSAHGILELPLLAQWQGPFSTPDIAYDTYVDVSTSQPSEQAKPTPVAVTPVWDAIKQWKEKQLIGHQGSVRNVAFSPDRAYLASGSDDMTVRLWDVTDGKEIHRLEGHTNWVGSVAFSKDGRYLASAGGDSLALVWEVSSRRKLRVLGDRPGWIFSLALSPFNLLAIGGGDSTIQLWEVRTAKQVRRLTGHQGWVQSLTFRSDGKYLASGSSDKSILLWEAPSWTEVCRIGKHAGVVNSLAFSPDGYYLVSAGDDGLIMLWKMATKEEAGHFEGHKDGVKSVAFSPDGKYLASGSDDKTARLWEVSSGKELKRQEIHNGTINCVSFSPNGSLLACACSDGIIYLYQPA